MIHYILYTFNTIHHITDHISITWNITLFLYIRDGFVNPQLFSLTKKNLSQTQSLSPLLYTLKSRCFNLLYFTFIHWQSTLLTFIFHFHLLAIHTLNFYISLSSTGNPQAIHPLRPHRQGAEDILFYQIYKIDTIIPLSWLLYISSTHLTHQTCHYLPLLRKSIYTIIIYTKNTSIFNYFNMLKILIFILSDFY